MGFLAASVSKVVQRRKRLTAQAPISTLIFISLLIFLVLLLAMAAIMYAIEHDNEVRGLQADSDAWVAERQDRLARAAGVSAALGSNQEALANLTVLLNRLDSAAGSQPDPSSPNWSYIGCIYFTFTVFAAIGYGTFSPATVSGRMIVCTLGLVGIGALVSLLGALSVGLHRVCLLASARLCPVTNPDTGLRVPSRKGPILALVFVIFGYWAVSMFVFEELSRIEGDDWGLDIAFYYTAVTFATIGFGDYSLRWYGDHAVLEVTLLIVFTLFGLVAFIELSSLIAHEVNYRIDLSNALPTDAKVAPVGDLHSSHAGKARQASELDLETVESPEKGKQGVRGGAADVVKPLNDPPEDATIAADM